MQAEFSMQKPSVSEIEDLMSIAVANHCTLSFDEAEWVIRGLLATQEMDKHPSIDPEAFLLALILLCNDYPVMQAISYCQNIWTNGFPK